MQLIYGLIASNMTLFIFLVFYFQDQDQRVNVSY